MTPTSTAAPRRRGKAEPHNSFHLPFAAADPAASPKEAPMLELVLMLLAVMTTNEVGTDPDYVGYPRPPRLDPDLDGGPSPPR